MKEIFFLFLSFLFQQMKPSLNEFENDFILRIATNETNLKILVSSNSITKYKFRTTYALFNRLQVK